MAFQPIGAEDEGDCDSDSVQDGNELWSFFFFFLLNKTNCDFTTQIPRLLAMNRLDDLDHIRQLNRKVVRNSNGDTCKKKKELKGWESPNSSSLVVVHQHQFSDVKPMHNVNDISKGEERDKISLVNELK